MYSYNKPKYFDSIRVNHKNSYKINYNIRFNDDLKCWEWDTALVEGSLTYDKIVDAMVDSKYPKDKMQAIINNYLIDPTDEHVDEFKQMQDFRKYSKGYAKEILK